MAKIRAYKLAEELGIERNEFVEQAGGARRRTQERDGVSRRSSRSKLLREKLGVGEFQVEARTSTSGVSRARAGTTVVRRRRRKEGARAGAGTPGRARRGRDTGAGSASRGGARRAGGCGCCRNPPRTSDALRCPRRLGSRGRSSRGSPCIWRGRRGDAPRRSQRTLSTQRRDRRLRARVVLHGRRSRGPAPADSGGPTRSQGKAAQARPRGREPARAGTVRPSDHESRPSGSAAWRRRHSARWSTRARDVATSSRRSRLRRSRPLRRPALVKVAWRHQRRGAGQAGRPQGAGSFRAS